MKITKGEMAVFAIALAAFIVGACFYPYLPERMASHWNARGEVDGYMSKAWGAFLMPIVILGLGLPFMVIVRIDPLKANIEKFRKYYDGFIILFSVFLFCLNLWMLLWNIGYQLSLNIVIPIGVGVLIFYTGVLCENAKRNWFIGIRTPWTLSSDIVWDKTHKIGGILFKAVGIVILAGVFWPGYLCWFILIPTILVSVFLIVYSYVVYKEVGQIGDSAGSLNDVSGNGTWDSVKAGYLRQVEKALASAGHREKKQVIEDVHSHLDQRFSELGPDEQTWENMQAIITEMGPAGDYAELLETDSPQATKQIGGSIFKYLKIFALVVVFAGVACWFGVLKFDRLEDNIDFPFADDPEVIGKWTSVDLVDSINDFDPGIKRQPGDLFLNELVFHENGRILSKNDNVKNGFWLKWTRGIVICPDDKTAEKYHIKEIDGEKYMFYEWKSGDYTVRHRKPHYYVLKKEPVETDIAVVDFKVHGCYDDQLRAKGFYDVTASIRNKGEQQTDQFGVYFYRGDPATNKPRTHAAGPIKSGGTWNEYTGPFELKEGTNVFSVVIDPGNKISDPDRSNNTETLKVTVKDGRIAEEISTKEQRELSSDQDIAIEDIRIDPYREGGLYSVTVSIRNKGEDVSPKFGVYFYQGDPGDVKPMTHGAGPIEPGDVWNARSMPFALKEGINQITTIIDPDDSFAESDEKNNRAWIRLVVNEGRITDKTTGFGKSRMGKKPAKDGVSSARDWLSLIDNDEYGASWEAAADIFKNAATKEGWENMAKMVREPLGKVISRQVMSKIPTQTVPGGPDGEYVIIQFKTSFENKADAIETVTPMLDKDGVWRVSGYYIK